MSSSRRSGNGIGCDDVLRSLGVVKDPAVGEIVLEPLSDGE